jgi:fructose-1-phosphate kinase PfkB-like protein
MSFSAAPFIKSHSCWRLFDYSFSFFLDIHAGDCFTAAFAVAILEGRPYREAMRFASAAAALCIQAAGAMPSMPSRRQVDAALSAAAS